MKVTNQALRKIVREEFSHLVEIFGLFGSDTGPQWTGHYNISLEDAKQKAEESGQVIWWINV